MRSDKKMMELFYKLIIVILIQIKILYLNFCFVIFTIAPKN